MNHPGPEYASTSIGAVPRLVCWVGDGQHGLTNMTLSRMLAPFGQHESPEANRSKASADGDLIGSDAGQRDSDLIQGQGNCSRFT